MLTTLLWRKTFSSALIVNTMLSFFVLDRALRGGGHRSRARILARWSARKCDHEVNSACTHGAGGRLCCRHQRLDHRNPGQSYHCHAVCRSRHLVGGMAAVIPPLKNFFSVFFF